MLITMEASFKSDAKIVKECANNLELELSDLKSKSLTEELSQSDDLENTIKLIEDEQLGHYPPMMGYSSFQDTVKFIMN